MLVFSHGHLFLKILSLIFLNCKMGMKFLSPLGHGGKGRQRASSGHFVVCEAAARVLRNMAKGLSR